MLLLLTFYGIIYKQDNLINLKQFIMEAYCVKCREKREIKDAKEIIMEGKGDTKRRAMTGVCPVCGTKMFRFLPKA